MIKKKKDNKKVSCMFIKHKMDNAQPYDSTFYDNQIPTAFAIIFNRLCECL